MENGVTSSEKTKLRTGEIQNGLVELPNGEQNTLVTCDEEIASVNFEELSNASANNEQNELDPLSNGATIDTIVEPDELPSDTTILFTEESVNGETYDAALQPATEFSENSEIEPNINFILTKIEHDLDYNESENASSVSSLTIANVFSEVFTDHTDDSKDQSISKKSQLDSLSRASKKSIKSLVKQTKSLTSAEYLWLVILVASKCENITITDEKNQIIEMVNKIVSKDSKQNIKELLGHVQDFTSVEYTALLRKLGDKRRKDKSSECIPDFSRSVMWFKTHLELDPEYAITKTKLSNAYTSYCNTHAMNSLKTTEFINLLRSVYPSVKEKRRDSKGLKCYLYSGIKKRDVLHAPKLPKFAEDQLHNNVLLAQYMSCHDCCSMYSNIILQKSQHLNRPKLKIKLQGLQTKTNPESSDLSPIIVDDPLDLLNVATTEKVAEDVKGKVVTVVDFSKADYSPVGPIKQVARKSVFSKRIRRIPSKYRDSNTSGSLLHTTYKYCEKIAAPTGSDYADKLQHIKDRLSRFVITKMEYGAKFKVTCTCCDEMFFVPEHHGRELLAAQEKLVDFYNSPVYLPKVRQNHHPSVKRLYNRYNNIVLPEVVIHDDINPTVSLNRFQVYDYFKSEVANLKRKLLESALNALNSGSRRSRYELKMPANPSDIISHTPKQITPPHPPIYISAVRETPKPREPIPPKIAEVFIKAESSSGKKRSNTREPEVIEISALKKPKPNYTPQLSSVYSRTRHMPYARRKDTDFVYFPAIDTSPNNLRLANLGTLYKCILCLMLFNTEEKLIDHEKVHLHCHKCRRKLRDVEVMRQHLIKHCQRNHRKRKPTLLIHRVDSIEIMVKKYHETFEISKTYYKDLKPKKKYREMIRPKMEPLPAAPIIEEVFISDVKSNIVLLPEVSTLTTNLSSEAIIDVKPVLPLMDVSNIPTEMPALETPVYATPFLNTDGDIPFININSNDTEPPKLLPFPSTSASPKKKNINKDSSSYTSRPVKIRVKDLMELS